MDYIIEKISEVIQNYYDTFYSWYDKNQVYCEIEDKIIVLEYNNHLWSIIAYEIRMDMIADIYKVLEGYEWTTKE